MISIVIPTYNRKLLLRYTLKSVVEQNFGKNDMEVIVVDDGSADLTRQVIDEFRPYLNLKYFYQEDKGYRVASARNLGIKKSAFDILLMIDSGVVLHPDAVASHVSFHHNQEKNAAVIGLVYGFSTHDTELNVPVHLQKLDDIPGLFDWLVKDDETKDIRETEYKTHGYRIDHLPAPWAFFWTNHVSIHKYCLAEDEDYFDLVYEPNYGYEDIDLGYRLFQRDIKIFLHMNARSFHYPHKKMEKYREFLDVNKQVFRGKYKNKVTELFAEVGTFGFNQSLLALNPSELNCLYSTIIS